jgi:hypothetical protein
MGPGGYVWLDKGEIAALAEALALAADDFGRKYLRKTPSGLALIDGPGGDGVLFGRGERRCRVYAARPSQCRSWPWWAENLRSADAWRREAARCPGMDRGPVWPRERIEDARP